MSLAARSVPPRRLPSGARRPAPLVLPALLACLSCVPAGPPPSADPAYGPAERMSALFYGGFEVMALRPCPDGRCRPGRASDEQCWTDVSPRAADEWSRLLAGVPVLEGYQRLEILARRRLVGGPFGHLGGYSCEIRIERVFAACQSDFQRRHWNGC